MGNPFMMHKSDRQRELELKQNLYNSQYLQDYYTKHSELNPNDGGYRDSDGVYHEHQFAAGPDWQPDPYGGLTPDEAAELRQLRDASYGKAQRNMKIGMGVATAAMGGLGALEGATSGATAVPPTFIPGVDSAASALLPEVGGAGIAQVPAWALPGGASASELAGMGLGGSAAAGASAGSSIWDSIKNYLGSLPGTPGGNKSGSSGWGDLLSQLISSGTNAYMGNKQAGQYNDVINQINQLYAPDSPYAKQMQQAMERKDAAAGRNSQYGTRGVELAAALTKDKANALTSAGYQNLLQQRGINQNVPWNGFLAALGSGPGQDIITRAGGNVGGWLGGLFSNNGKQITPTTPNSGGGNWWDNWGGYIGGGP